ncbi:MAG: Na/Pi cotransporter family protein, partial [Lachnospiraceae bacterium]|nr:Na/Pi cotransporter family protein [Lachnospiraceae bacterium]
MESVAIALSLLSGVAFFLYGMAVMGDSLKQVAGTKLERILYRLTNTRIKGILLGIVVTALIQSSSATTVMVVGFVNSGMMKLIQAISVIMGSSIGTSITGWILCLSYIEGGSGIATLLSSATIAAIVAIAGIFLKKLSKHSRNRHIGDIMLGFAILMVGMQMMSAAMSPLRDNPDFLNILMIFNHPLLCILIGIIFTAILQSSSAAIGILQAISVTGVLTFSNTFPLILGVGIGASAPVLLSSIGTNTNGKRTAFVYLIDDLIGATIWGTVFYVVNACVDLP